MAIYLLFASLPLLDVEALAVVELEKLYCLNSFVGSESVNLDSLLAMRMQSTIGKQYQFNKSLKPVQQCTGFVGYKPILI